MKLLGSILSVLLFAATTFAEAPAAKIAAALQPFVDDSALAGAVTLVADKDKILDLEAVGYRDVAAKDPMASDDLFWIASQSKGITAAGLMILVDEGKVNVEDPVEKYLPEFKGEMVEVEADAEHKLLKKPKHPILIRNILTHTSGLPAHTAIEEPSLDLYPLEMRVKSYAMVPLMFEPDTKYSYSNAGINTAGRIIEVVSGKPYADFLSERIFVPLGMKDTTFWPSEEQLKKLAKAYKPTKSGLQEIPIGQLHYPLTDKIREPMPAGGLFSTANDLSIFYRMLVNGGEFQGKRILSEAAVKQMTSKQTAEGLNSYGFGLSANKNGGFGHGGAYSTDSAYDSNHGLITIFLVQHAGWNAEGKKVLPTFKQAAVKFFAPQ